MADSDAIGLQRPPYQGVGQVRLLEVAGVVTSLNEPARATGGLIDGAAGAGGGIDLAEMVSAPPGRADSFWVGINEQTAPAPGSP